MPQQKRPLSDIFNEQNHKGGLDDIFSDTPAAPAAQDTTQTPQVTPQSTDQTTVEDISWAEAVGGFRPDRLAKKLREETPGTS